MTEVTPAQGRYLSYIQAYMQGFGLPPAESEIAKALNVSPPSVNQMIKSLEKKGHIRRRPGVARSIEILVTDDAIPKWKGKRIRRTVKVWTYVGPTVRPGAAGNGNETVYRFKITLQNTNPAIWRRMETRNVSLEKLHELIQTAMGWTNSHLHRLAISGARYMHPRFRTGDFEDMGALDYSGIQISDLVSEHGSKLRMSYEYDFGDGWQHAVVLEKITQAEPRAKYPRCIDGERACPPEDVGGVYGFAEFVAAITNPKHREHDELLKWNGPFDPAQFDAAIATRRMKKGLPTW